MHIHSNLSKADQLKYLLKRYPLLASILLLFSDCCLSLQVELKDLSYILTLWQTIHHRQNIQEQCNKFSSVKSQKNSWNLPGCPLEGKWAWNWQNPLEEPSSNWWPSRSLSWCPHDGRRTCALGPQLWGSGKRSSASQCYLRTDGCWCGRRGCLARTAWRAWLPSQMLFLLPSRQTVLCTTKPDFQFLKLLLEVVRGNVGSWTAKTFTTTRPSWYFTPATLKKCLLPRLLQWKPWMSEKYSSTQRIWEGAMSASWFPRMAASTSGSVS